jgi:hypothetical protein
MRGRKLNTDEFIKRSKLVHGDIYDYSLVDYKNTFTKVKIRCYKHGIFEQFLEPHTTKKLGCPDCNQELKSQKFIEKSIKKYGSKYDYNLVKYNGIHKKVKIKCNNCKEILEITPESHLYGIQCVNCHGYENLRFTQDEYIKKIKQVHGESRYNYSLVEYKNSDSMINILCNKCGEIFLQNARQHMRKSGCPICADNKKLTTEEYIKRAIKRHGNIRYDYSLVEYVNNNTKVKIKCNKCNYIFDVPAESHSSGQGCPKCNESKGEIKVSNFLKENNIKYFIQHRFKNCRYKLPLPFDFYLPEHNICIEFDGVQHFTSNCYFGGKERNNEKLFEDIKIRDNIKNVYCEKNNIKLIRIKYTESISKKLSFLINI